MNITRRDILNDMREMFMSFSMVYSGGARCHDGVVMVGNKTTLMSAF